MTKQEIIDNIPCSLYVTENLERMQDLDNAVTITLIVYNSSKFVIDTLESAKQQTYPHIILQISDDCSTDDTIGICRQWIETNKDRFIKTKIIVPEHNTGVTANLNRGWDVCETKFNKDIAGDDILLPNCIEDNMLYMRDHPDAVFVFSKIQCFGIYEERNRKVEKLFDYSKFKLAPERQLKIIIEEGNFVPASAAFVNLKKVREAGIRNDERIPMLEDLPKWVNVLRAGFKLHFFEKTTVKYRISEGSLTTSAMPSPRFIRSDWLYWFYYYFDELYKQDKELAVAKAVDKYIGLYEYMYKVKNSAPYKLYSKMKLLIKKLGLM